MKRILVDQMFLIYVSQPYNAWNMDLEGAIIMSILIETWSPRWDWCLEFGHTMDIKMIQEVDLNFIDKERWNESSA